MMGGFIFAMTFFFFSLTAHAREVEFSWDAMVGALKYEIQVGADEKFVGQPVATAQVDNPSYSTELPIGRYFYRVRVIDKKSKPGKWSKPELVNVAPYPPELLEPTEEIEYSYFEVLPQIEFSWKPVKGSAEYEILIFKTTGQKVLEDKLKATTFTTGKIGEGEYGWKIRTVAEKGLTSDYSEPRHFNVVKKDLTKPELIKPAKDGLSPAYRAVDFEWKQDPATRFTDLTFEKVKGRGADFKPFKKTIENVTGSTYTAPYEEPGEYKWSVLTKEAKDTPGIASDVYNFEARDDVLSRGNYELEFSLSPVGDLYTTTSARQTGGTALIAQQSTSQGVFVGFSAGYYALQSVGFFLSTRTAQLGVENLNGLQQETDMSLHLRFGSKGFFQEFIYGLRFMDLIEAENTPTQKTTDFTTTGPLLGTRLGATLMPGLKLQANLFYFKPLSNVQGIGGFVGDVYGGYAALKWNFMYQFWLGYRVAMERINCSFGSPGMSQSVTSSWTQYRTEPFYISISFEH